MKKLLPIFTLFLMPLFSVAQFAPSVGQIGTSAISADSNIFAEWVTGCTITRGFQDISNPSLGYTSVGDPTFATEKAGINGVVSLGDGGVAILTFSRPIKNGEGWDFAVFENSFNDLFLELAFVEVSSDGINYFRFPATSNTQDTLQVDGFGELDATKINNFAGKYRGGYGTPFDLEELKNIPQLNVDAITHVKIIDVVGCIQSQYASIDNQGKKVNDPWPTPFPSSGFDLDAVGVIHQVPANVEKYDNFDIFSVYPNPAKDKLMITNSSIQPLKHTIQNNLGQIIYQSTSNKPIESIDLQDFSNGIYIIIIESNLHRSVQKFMIAR